jgi:hypothetical protein
MSILTFFIGLALGFFIGTQCAWRKVLGRLGAYATAKASAPPPASPPAPDKLVNR